MVVQLLTAVVRVSSHTTSESWQSLHGLRFEQAAFLNLNHPESVSHPNSSSRRLLGKSYMMNTLVMSLVMKRYSSKNHFTAFSP